MGLTWRRHRRPRAEHDRDLVDGDHVDEHERLATELSLRAAYAQIGTREKSEAASTAAESARSPA
jgi:hypothetical protein